MIKIPSIGMALLSVAVIVPAAFAADPVPVTQPNNGFIQAANPEWTAAHETSVSTIAGHRPYHREAEATLLRWYAAHVERGTAAYNAARRVMLQTRNMLHRQFHLGMNNGDNGQQTSSVQNSVSSRPGVSSSSRTSTTTSSTVSSSSSSVSSSSVTSQTSSTSSVAAQGTVSLGAASTFAVLAGSTVTNTGPTTVTGDLGLSPGSSITGFGPGVVTGGSMQTGTGAAAAQSALTVAYNDLAGRTLAPVDVSGNLGGMTLSPGLYKATSSVEISSGDLTLDAKGNANAIFIFQVATTFNMATGRQMTLIGGAKASNVYWQVGTSATINANAVFKGNILADQSISVKTGATVEGRLLARIGAVTLQSNTITVPAN